jgi:hypothetical protein
VRPAPGGDPSVEFVALIGEIATMPRQLILRTVSRETGARVAPDQAAAIPGEVAPADVLFSTLYRPDRILVLLEDLTVLAYDVAFDAGGQAKLVGETPAVLGPFGNPAEWGDGTALAEMPDVQDVSNSFLGIGTSRGGVMLCPSRRDMPVTTVDLGDGAITGLGSVPQVGAFVFVAAIGGRLVGTDPLAVHKAPAGIVFDLADPRSRPLTHLSTGIIDPQPMLEAAPVSFVAASGSDEVAVLTIPPDPQVGGTLTVALSERWPTIVERVALGGSLVSITINRNAVIDPGFTLSSGSSGTRFALAGASADVDPDVVNLGGRGKAVTAYVEVENGAAAHIALTTLALEAIDSDPPPTGCFPFDDFNLLKPLIEPPPLLGDADEDGQADVAAKFDRQALEALLANLRTSLAIIRVFWRYDDGSTGCGYGVLHIKKR